MTPDQKCQSADVFTAKHVAAAIKVLGLTYEDIAERTGIAWITISRFLSGKRVHRSTRDAIRNYLENEGFEFSATGLSHPQLFQ